MAWGERSLLPRIAALVAVAALSVLASTLSSERRALRALPLEERSSLVARTVAELRQSCTEQRPEALRGHCRELASFAAQFEECRGECEALVHRQLAPIPTR
ncbi:hypothetical protein [Anaeromyxobacter diazotrophicus]|uniref:Uncharacterized protein n=1 Tax=Anaeromyxobacter diazotrophicus TaxID=2590199 RepID=A0A7I9VGE8_9BACT|nr:hypothetical protein [Anaeromyxobacter diazotrophicus]GEJ55474.1 hypothetical protein AMYX_02150 [Anaeromyxobacter diazotrophicus]